MPKMDAPLKSSVTVTVSNEEPSIRWMDEELEDLSSISSEEDTTAEYNNEQRTRSKPVQEIWSPAELLQELQNLPDGEELLEILSKNEVEETVQKNVQTAILLACTLGKTNALKMLLENGVSVETCDANHRTTVHLASHSGKQDCLKLLLDYGAKVNVWDHKHQVTPLHCAASMGHLSCLKLLIKSGADVNAGLSNRSPLYYAVQSVAVDCVRELLEHNATPNTSQIFSETPLHTAAALGSTEIMRLLLNYGAAPNVQCGPEKTTPLHLAAEDGDAECTRLLLNAKASTTAMNHKNQTPLHLAALSQCSETLELLLANGADPNAADIDGRTPLHCSIVKVSRSCECVRILLNAGARVNQADAFGYTALHLAALNEFSHCLLLLINQGGDVTARTNGGASVLSFITRKTPDVIPKYISKFDASIKLNDHEIGDVDCELKLDFRVLVPTMGNKETELLLNFIEVGHKDVLKHPLCETFLFLKWRRIRKFFLFSLFYHSLFVLLYTIYIVGIFLYNSSSAYIEYVGYFLYCLNLMLLGKELFQIAHSWFVYIKQWENWLQWLIIISVCCCVQPTLHINRDIEVSAWQHQVAAIGIFLAWVELMMIVGRFPIFGLYIQMFTTVSVNFIKFLVAYVCLFIAFVLCFGVLFASYPAEDLRLLVVQVLLMMTGELGDIFVVDHEPIKYYYTALIMYLAFVLLITIILTNLMVGLAVSDIQGLQQSAGLDRLVRQAELVAHLESMLFSRLLTCIPHKFTTFFHKHALLLKSQYHWALYIKPNDPREKRIPKELLTKIFVTVAERKERPRSKIGRKYASFHRSSFCSPEISRINSYSSGVTDKKNLNVQMQLDELQNEMFEYNKILKHKVDKISLLLK